MSQQYEEQNAYRMASLSASDAYWGTQFSPGSSSGSGYGNYQQQEEAYINQPIVIVDRRREWQDVYAWWSPVQQKVFCVGIV